MQTGSRYSVSREHDPIFKVEALVLRDHRVGSQARVLPALGNNLMGFTARLSNGPLEVLLQPMAEEKHPDPRLYGCSILFPFPNRVRDAVYSFEGRRYHLEPDSTDGHHLHGLVRARAWQVMETESTLTGARVRCQFDADHFPAVCRQVPSPFTISVTYTLSGNTVRIAAEARNTGARRLPMGFGVLPFFRLPLAAEARPYDCVVCVPAARLWRLDHAKIPTGALEAVPPELDFRSCRQVAEAELDHLYGDIAREKGLANCVLTDRAARAQLSVRFGREFPVVSVLAPADRPTMCFQPYSCITNAVNLPPDAANGGLVILPPGGNWRGTVDLVVTELAG